MNKELVISTVASILNVEVELVSDILNLVESVQLQGLQDDLISGHPSSLVVSGLGTYDIDTGDVTLDDTVKYSIDKIKEGTYTSIVDDTESDLNSEEVSKIKNAITVLVGSDFTDK